MGAEWLIGVVFLNAHDDVKALELQAVVQAKHGRVIGFQQVVIAFDGSNDVIHAERYGKGQEGAFQGSLGGRAIGAFGWEHDAEIAQAHRRL